MNDRFEATLTVDLTPEAAWTAIARRDLADPHATRADDAATGQVWLPGWESTGEVLESVPGRLLRVRKDRMPCQGTEIVVTLEAADKGTKITVVQSGFGALFDVMVNWLKVGMDQIVADFALYLDRGVIAGRHMGLWMGPQVGFDFAEQPSGLVVLRVDADGWGARVGLQPGDHLLSLAQVPVTTTRDLAMVKRAFAPGASVAGAWLRGRETMRGQAAV